MSERPDDHVGEYDEINPLSPSNQFGGRSVPTVPTKTVTTPSFSSLFREGVLCDITPADPDDIILEEEGEPTPVVRAVK